MRKRDSVDQLDLEHRLRYCRLAVADSDWLEVSSWEGLHHSFVDFAHVATVHRERIHLSHPDVEVMYVCGADHAIKTGIIHSSFVNGIVVLERTGEDLEEYQLGEHVVVGEGSGDEVVSSTVVRKALAAHDWTTLESLLHPPVFEVLVEQKSKGSG